MAVASLGHSVLTHLSDLVIVHISFHSNTSSMKLTQSMNMSKISWGGMPPDPPRRAWIFIRFLDLPLSNPPKPKCLDPPLFWSNLRQKFGLSCSTFVADILNEETFKVQTSPKSEGGGAVPPPPSLSLSLSLLHHWPGSGL